MKKTILIIATVLLSVVLHAQNEFVPETYFGIKIGGNSSGIYSDPITYQNIYPGFTGGLIFKHFSQKIVGIQIELNYQQAGWSENLKSPNKYERRLDYLQLPFMTHISIGNKKMRYIINLGPYVSYLLSEKDQMNLFDESHEKSYYGQKVDYKAGVGFCFGVGVGFHSSIGLFQAEARGSASLTDLFRTTTNSTLSSSKNIGAEVSISYLIDYNVVKSRTKSLIDRIAWR